jgi:hypothetical protein
MNLIFAGTRASLHVSEELLQSSRVSFKAMYCFLGGDAKLKPFTIFKEDGETMGGLFIYAALWLMAFGLTKYAFKVNPILLLPSAACLLPYVVSLCLESSTKGKNQITLHSIWIALFLIPLAASLVLIFLKGVSVRPFLFSLVFQIPFLAYLYYYGGLMFTHKFG